MASSDSLEIDDELARMLAAYDQGIGDPDVDAPTLNVEKLPPEVQRFLEETDEPELPSTQHAEPALTPANPIPMMPANHGVTHRVGRFELRKQLGKGGCGIVFLAYDSKLLREVALKIPRPEMLLNADARRRLFREALAAAEFDHPNLVPVYETGEIGPVCFIASAFCPGETLAEWLRRQSFPVPLRQAARLVAVLAEAVQHAHNRNVLHRDLKPNNILLQGVKSDPHESELPPGACVLRGETFIPRVVDFGLAKVAERSPSETGARQILGTPKYMAPEQAQARRDEIGPTADVYALGVILYELAAGRAPYEGETDVEVLRQSVEGKLTPPRTFRTDMPRDLEAICLKAMARLPSRRYPTAVDFADDLRRFLDGRSTIARPLGRSARTLKWFRRNDELVALVLVSSLALFFLVVGSLSGHQTRQLKSDRDSVLRQQATSKQQDRDREYATRLRRAFHSWKSGDAKQMTDSLESARGLASLSLEPPCFVWEYLNQLGNLEKRSLATPHGHATSLAVSPDGKLWATAHFDGTLTVWNAATGEIVGSARTSPMPTCIAFLANGERLIAGGDSERLRVWNLGSTLKEADAIHTNGRVTCLAATHDQSAIAIGTDRGECGFLKGDGTDITGSWSAATEPIVALAVSPDGKSIATAARGGAIRVWKAESHKLEREFPGTPGITVLAFVPHSKAQWSLAVANGNQGVVQFLSPDGQDTTTLAAHSEPILAMAVSSDGRTLATGSGDQAICVWDTASGTLRTLLRGHTQPVTSLRFTHEGQTLLSVSEDGTLKTWNPNAEEFTRYATASTVAAVRFQPDSGRFAMAFSDGTVAIEALRNDSNTPRLKSTDRTPLSQIRYPAERPPVALEIQSKKIVCWELANERRAVFQADSPAGRSFTSVDFSDDAVRMAAGDDQGRITVWSIPEQTKLGSFATGVDGPVRALAFDPDGRQIVTLAHNQSVAVWDDSGTGPNHRVSGHGDGTRLLRFFPSGDRFATAGRGSAIRIWSIGGQELTTLVGHTGQITALAISPDNRVFASGSSTGEVKFWHVKTGLELATFPRHSGPVTVLEFAGDGRTLFSAAVKREGGGEYVLWETMKNSGP